MSERELELTKAKEAKLEMINALSAQGEDVSVLYREIAKIDKELGEMRLPPAGKVHFLGSTMSLPLLALALYGAYYGGMKAANYLGLTK